VSALRETGEALARVPVHRVDALSAGPANLGSQTALVHQVQHRLISFAAEAEFYVLGHSLERTMFTSTSPALSHVFTAATVFLGEFHRQRI